MCRRCAMPLATEAAPCPRCLGKGLPPFKFIVRLGHFQDPIRPLIHQIKYHARWPLAEFLAERLLQQESTSRLLAQAQVLVSVPLHPWRQMSRGFNQAEVIARRIGKHYGIKVARPVVRLKDTPTQTQLHSREKRIENLRGAFGLLRPAAVRSRHVVIVDDVMTTGATLASVARTLAPAHPASLSALVIAVADPRERAWALK